MSWYEKLKSFGIQENEFEAFCNKYPQFKSNKELMAKLYLSIVKGVRVAEPKIVGEFVKISELSVGVVSRIKVVVIQHIETRSYVGCPKCYKKLQVSPNTITECMRDGTVKAQLLEWSMILAGDDTGEILLTISPSINQLPQPGEIIAVEGVLNESEEFFVYRYTSAPMEEAKPAIQQVATIQPQVETKEAPKVEAKVAEVVCPVCGKSQKNLSALKIHAKLAHKKSLGELQATTQKIEQIVKEVLKEEAKVVEEKKEEKFPEEAIKLARVAGMINKPYEEFKTFITNKYPNINIDELLKEAGIVVEEGILKKST
jgi:uncharacterized Zn finger protein (UPF0148 family)